MKRFLFFLAVSVFGLGSALAQDGTKLEAEDAIYENCELVEGDQYSGGKALAMKESNGKISFNYTAAEGGKFTVYVGYDGQWGDKTVNITVNGSTGTFQTPVAGVGEIEAGAFIMNEGENTIEITPSWTWYLIDYIRIVSGSSSTLHLTLPHRLSMPMPQKQPRRYIPSSMTISVRRPSRVS